MFIYTGKIIVKLKTTVTALAIAAHVDTSSPEGSTRRANLALNTSTFLNLFIYKRLRIVVACLLIDETEKN